MKLSWLLPFVIACGGSASSTSAVHGTPGSMQIPAAAPTPEHTGAPASDTRVSASAATRPSSPGEAPPSLAWLPEVGFGAPGPIRVEGYTRRVHTGMNDPADRVGFSADGEYLGYCATIGARDPGYTLCELLPRTGEALRLESDVKNQYDPAAAKRLEAWVKEHGIPAIRADTKDVREPTAPKLEGTWRFAQDITLAVEERAQGKRGAAVRVGGRVGSEAPVFPVFVDRAPSHGLNPFHTSWVNSFTLSPDGRELGLVAGFFCMEWCDAFTVRRLDVSRLASQIFNDTGMRHHGKADYRGSAALFAKAVHADPTHALAAYNLACAYARLRDPSTKPALDYAVRVGGDAVLERAKRDPDFDAVRTETWWPAK